MTAQFKNNILTVFDGKGNSLSYYKDVDKWRDIITNKMVPYDDFLMLNRIMKMASDARREGRVIKIEQ